MKALILQHASFETPGYILDWLKIHQYETIILKLYEMDEKNIPLSYNINLLIIMGGPMSVHDEKKYQWLSKEKQLIKNLINKNIPTLGICLGAQLIADVYDAHITIANHKEIGWFPIQVIQSKESKKIKWPENFVTFLWHGEQFDIPAHAKLLAFSQGCPHQAFMIKNNVIGLQFHPEMTLTMIQNMIENCYDQDKTLSPFVQSIKEILSVPKEHYSINHQIIDNLLSYLTT